MRLTAKQRSLLRSTLLMIMSLTLVLLAELIGWLDASNEAIRVWYYRYSPERVSAQKVVVVAANQRTALNWSGTSHAEELHRALGRVMEGRPSLVVLVDPETVFGIDKAALDDILNTPAWGDRIVVARASIPTRQGVGGVAFIEHEVEKDAFGGRSSIYTAVSKRTALSQIQGQSLRIHYLNSRSSLPIYPFSAVSAGKLQVQGFEGRIVLVGPTGPPWVQPVATPIGEMSPLEVHAHALAAVVDGVVWAEITRVTRACALIVALLLWTIWVRGRGRPTSLRATILASLLIILMDYIAYTRGILCWGPGGPILAIWSAQLLFLRDSLNYLTDKVASMQSRLAELLPSPSANADVVDQNLSDAAFWQDLVDLGRAYVKFDVGAVIAELPEGEWHLQLRASSGVALVDVEEKRRDIRRAPFRGPFLTHRSGWTRGFFRDSSNDQTLLVPLQSESRLVGFWLVHLHPEQKVNDEFIRACESLGQQMAAMILLRRSGAPVGEIELGKGGEHAVDEVERDLGRVEQERRWALELLEQNQEGVLMASLWGPVELMNQPMREHVQSLFPDGIPGDDIRAVVAKITGGTMEQVQTLMRSAVVDGETVELPRPVEQTLQLNALMRYSLRRIELGESSGGNEYFPDMSRVRLVLSAVREKRLSRKSAAEPIGA